MYFFLLRQATFVWVVLHNETMRNFLIERCLTILQRNLTLKRQLIFIYVTPQLPTLRLQVTEQENLTIRLIFLILTLSFSEICCIFGSIVILFESDDAKRQAKETNQSNCISYFFLFKDSAVIDVIYNIMNTAKSISILCLLATTLSIVIQVPAGAYKKCLYAQFSPDKVHIISSRLFKLDLDFKAKGQVSARSVLTSTSFHKI